MGIGVVRPAVEIYRRTVDEDFINIADVGRSVGSPGALVHCRIGSLR